VQPDDGDSKQPERLDVAAGIAILSGLATIVGIFLAMQGIPPFGRLSAREPGFDRLENLFGLAFVVILMWIACGASPRRKSLSGIALAATFLYLAAFFAV
jgi:hypothetical protein